jgi:uroporphyrinogen III methyltransferase/synthase
MVTFTSSSTVRNFRSLLPPGPQGMDLMKGVHVACIGPITADTARSLGFAPDITAAQYTIPGLCQALIDFYAPG